MQRILLDSFSAAVRDCAVRAASTGVPVLLSGETGCGKTVLARLIHQASSRAQMPFVRADCGSIPDSLFEREMFGHTRGSFTDAKDSQPGLFEAADGGTLFLDEVGELPLCVQPKLLSVLDDGLVRRIGSTKSTHIDLRIVAATNRDLSEMLRAKAFRSDLYYRLGFLKIHLPPLREQRASIPQLAADVLQLLVTSKRIPERSAPELHPETVERLQAYDWPGNIREFEQALTFAITYFQSPVIWPEHLPAEVANGAHFRAAGRGVRPASRYTAPGDPEAERYAVAQALQVCHGNRTKAAKLLGMSRATLWVKLRQFGIDVLTTGGDDTAQSRPVAWEPEVFARPEVRRVAAADNGAGELPPFA